MKKLLLILACTMLVPALANAQSSGNYSYGTGFDSAGNPITTACMLQANGKISGGIPCDQTCTQDPVTGVITCTPANGPSTGCIGNAYAGIKTSSGSGNVFVIRPSAVIGLLTDVTITSKQATAVSSALAGIDFTVNVASESNPQQKVNVIPPYTITYDARYVQISTNLFAGLSATCTTAVGGCFISFNESTVSAHSFDWIAGAPGANGSGTLTSGQYDVTTNWAPSAGFGVSGIGEALACVGPVNLTVQQNKIFHFNQVNDVN
jgi:hypothetical protein